MKLSDRVHTSGAQISACGFFRYRLWRLWDSDKPRVMFIMLNPSTADQHANDRTIEWLMRWADRNGFGGIEVCNLYAYRTKDPRELKRAGMLVGANNDAALFATARSVMADAGGKIICAWGAHAESDKAARLRWLMLNEGWPLYVLKLNTGGSPAHPLYLPGDVQAVEWEFDFA